MVTQKNNLKVMVSEFSVPMLTTGLPIYALQEGAIAFIDSKTDEVAAPGTQVEGYFATRRGNVIHRTINFKDFPGFVASIPKAFRGQVPKISDTTVPVVVEGTTYKLSVIVYTQVYGNEPKEVSYTATAADDTNSVALALTKLMKGILIRLGLKYFSISVAAAIITVTAEPKTYSPGKSAGGYFNHALSLTVGSADPVAATVSQEGNDGIGEGWYIQSKEIFALGNMDAVSKNKFCSNAGIVPVAKVHGKYNVSAHDEKTSGANMEVIKNHVLLAFNSEGVAPAALTYQYDVNGNVTGDAWPTNAGGAFQGLSVLTINGTQYLGMSAYTSGLTPDDVLGGTFHLFNPKANSLLTFNSETTAIGAGIVKSGQGMLATAFTGKNTVSHSATNGKLLWLLQAGAVWQFDFASGEGLILHATAASAYEFRSKLIFDEVTNKLFFGSIVASVMTQIDLSTGVVSTIGGAAADKPAVGDPLVINPHSINLLGRDLYISGNNNTGVYIYNIDTNTGTTLDNTTTGIGGTHEVGGDPIPAGAQWEFSAVGEIDGEVYFMAGGEFAGTLIGVWLFNVTQNTAYNLSPANLAPAGVYEVAGDALKDGYLGGIEFINNKFYVYRGDSSGIQDGIWVYEVAEHRGTQYTIANTAADPGATYPTTNGGIQSDLYWTPGCKYMVEFNGKVLLIAGSEAPSVEASHTITVFF